MAEPQLKRRLIIPNDFTSTERQLLADLVIDFIQKRTARGKDVNNAPFPSYSKEYIASREFQIAGKSRRVNLSQTGDTIASIELISHGSGFITIGYDAGSFENDKAVWLQRSDNGVSRKFLGLTNADLNRFVKKVESERSRGEDVRERRSLSATIVQNILSRLGI